MSAVSPTLTAEDWAEIEAENDRRCAVAIAGLDSALQEAYKALGHATRHLGVLMDEAFHADYAEGTDGSDLADHLDAAKQQIRAAQRCQDVIERATA